MENTNNESRSMATDFQIEPYTKLVPLDPEQAQMVDDWIKGPQVEIYREYDPDTGFQIACRDRDGRPVFIAITDFISINGVRWNLVPGYNSVPKPVADFIRQNQQDKQQFYRKAQNVSAKNHITELSR